MSKKERPPIVVIVGHIDHGKSKLLDYIRKSNVVEKEVGGITQRISAYEAEVILGDGRKKKITFIDTPGHAAFSQMRTRGCNIADIAILIVSAEEGVKTQTTEALKSIKECGIPFIVAINKVDKPNANIEKTKNELLEKEVYLEGLGGDVPYVPISAVTGKGVDDLLETIVLMAEINELKGDDEKLAEGYVIEANMDPKRGVSASVVISDGVLKSGMFIVSGLSTSPVRIMENFLGKMVKEAGPSDPVNITGWDKLPVVGSSFKTYLNKKDIVLEKDSGLKLNSNENNDLGEGSVVFPLIIKADSGGSVEAIVNEVNKIKEEKVFIKVIEAKTGNITENDIKLAGSSENSVVIGFTVKEDKGVKALAEKLNVEIKNFDIIYKLTEWLEETVKARRPKFKVEEVRGKVRILKIFSKNKDKQVLGGEVFEGSVSKGDKVKILRRGEEIGFGSIVELQSGKTAVQSVNEGNQFGAKIASNVEIFEKDNLESVKIVEK
jgi:translation initiation factor IF-2